MNSQIRHEENQDAWSSFAAWLKECLPELNADDLKVPVELLYEELVAFNTHTNVTRITDFGDFLSKHIADSILGLKAFPDLLSKPLTVIDIGCGGGFPGLPLALLCKASTFTEVDSVAKKLTFVDHAVQKLSLTHMTTCHGRARELGRLSDHQKHYELILARAVAESGDLIKECRQLLCSDGMMLLYKTPAAVVQEAKVTEREAKKAGLIIRQSEIWQLPDGSERQFIMAGRFS